MKILVLDPAASTGYCVVEVDGKDATIYEYGFIEVDTASLYEGDWYLDLQSKIFSIMHHHMVDEVAVEDYFFSSKFAQGTNVNTAYRTAIHILCRQNGLPYDILNISQWKKHVAGRSTPTKEQKKKWGKEAAKKLYMQQALWDIYGIKFPNHSLSKKTGKPVLFRYDIVDAVAQAIFHCESKYRVKNIHVPIAVPPDVVFKKPSKKMFTYT